MNIFQVVGKSMKKSSTTFYFPLLPSYLSLLNGVTSFAEILKTKKTQYPQSEEESNATISSQRVSERIASKLIKVKFQGILSPGSPANLVCMSSPSHMLSLFSYVLPISFFSSIILFLNNTETNLFFFLSLCLLNRNKPYNQWSANLVFHPMMSEWIWNSKYNHLLHSG